MLSLANESQTLKEFDMTNLRQTWQVHWLGQSKTNGQYPAFAAPFPPPRDLHGGPFPTHGELAQGLTLTMRPTRTASPLTFFLTAVTKNLAIARFLCEYSGPFWGIFSKLRPDIYAWVYIACLFCGQYSNTEGSVSQQLLAKRKWIFCLPPCWFLPFASP